MPDLPLAAALQLRRAGHDFWMVPVVADNPDSQVYLAGRRCSRYELQKLRVDPGAEADWSGVVLIGTSGPGRRVGRLVLFGDPERVAAYAESLTH